MCAGPLRVVPHRYGEGEQKLAALFGRCEQLGACVLFLDEIDALAGSREREMHEASRRMLSTLLRHLDGFDACRHVALIAATNRPADLDPALLSRFDVRVAFPAPDAPAKAMIFGRYAKHLSADERGALADAAVGLSGRDVLDACKHAERRWVYERLRGVTVADGATTELEPPPLRLYMESVAARCAAIGAAAGEASTKRKTGGRDLVKFPRLGLAGAGK